MNSYTFELTDQGRVVSKIEGLSKDAAFEVARASSISGPCYAYTYAGKDGQGYGMLRVYKFVNCALVREYITGVDEEAV